MNYPITLQTTVDTLVDLWLRQLRAEERLEGSTIDEYERVLRKLVVPRIGGARLSELTMNRINVVLAELGTESLNFQRKAKVVTGAMLDTAVELGALTVNPVRGSLSISRPEPEHRSLTASELKTVRVAVRAWLSKERSGPRSSGDIADIIEMMVATGARIGEVLALRWADIDLSTRVVVAFVWAVLASVTNFIPNIGFIIGVIPPALIALLDGGPGLMVAVIVVYSVINFLIQLVIQPRVVGDEVGLTPMLTFLSLVSWTWVVGPLGALLAVPLTLLTKALLVEADPRTRWALPLITGTPEKRTEPEPEAAHEPLQDEPPG